MPRPETNNSSAAQPLSWLLASLVEDGIDSVRVAPLDAPCSALYINRAGCSMFGVSGAEEFNRRDPSDFFGDSGVRVIADQAGEAAQRGRTWSGQLTARNAKTGERTYLLVHSYPVTDPDTGEPSAIAFIDRDVTELESIKTARSRLSAIVEHSRDLIAYASVDDPMRLTYVNPAGLEMLGISRVDEFNRLGAETFLGSDEVRRTLEQILPAIMGGETWAEEAVIRNASTGESVPVHRQIFPINDPVTGVTVARGIIVRNIGELKEAEERVRTALEQRESVVQTLQGLYARERRWGTQRKAIQEITTHASSILDRDELLKYVVRVIEETFDYRLVAIYIRAGDGSFQLASASGKAMEERGKRGVLPHGTSAVARAAESGVAITVSSDSSDSTEPTSSLNEAGPGVAIPIKGHDGVTGVIEVRVLPHEQFDEADRAIIEALANHLGVALENATMFNQASEIAALGERNRIAREIHDSLAQSLAEIRWLLETLQKDIRSGRKSALGAADTLNRLKDLARRALREARRSVWDLGPSELDARSLEDALRVSVTRIAREAGVDGDFESAGDSSLLPGEAKTAVLRVCQEALHNVRKHAMARNVDVMLTCSKQMVELTVTDDGRGLGADTGSGTGGGYGMTSMKGRAESVGGSLSITPGPGGSGTRVKLTIPLDRGRRS